jgi:hypothetical protein
LDKIHFISGNIEDPTMLLHGPKKIIEKFDLNMEHGPLLFLINTGAIQFLERIKTLLLIGGMFSDTIS